ncbi:MAG: NUDIX domain-containing protein [Schleiferiaceae bacterium]|nr:NUDIX domain-containing protein [Schleiferiaceae bacterium]
MKVVVGLLFDEEKFLIGQRLDENSSYGGYWELPGGKIDEGETSYDAIIREWKEELDIDVEAYYEIPNREINGVDTYPFLLRFKSGKPKLNVHQKVKFIDMSEIKSYKLTPISTEIVYIVRRSYSLFLRKKEKETQ